MYRTKKILSQKEMVSISLPDNQFFQPTNKRIGNDVVCILQNQFLDEIRNLKLISADKLEEFRYLCESYFEYLNQIEEEIMEEDNDERYL